MANRQATICGTSCPFSTWQRNHKLAVNPSGPVVEPTTNPTPPSAPQPLPEAPPSTLPPYSDNYFHIIAFKLYFNEEALISIEKPTTEPTTSSEEIIGHLHESSILPTHERALLFASHVAFAAASSGTLADLAFVFFLRTNTFSSSCLIKYIFIRLRNSRYCQRRHRSISDCSQWLYFGGPKRSFRVSHHSTLPRFKTYVSCSKYNKQPVSSNYKIQRRQQHFTSCGKQPTSVVFAMSSF